MEDDRFNIIGEDPRYRRMPKEERKVKIDRRFEGMFKDKRFKLKYSVDKRGRPLNATTNDNLRRFYEMSESESDDDDVTVQQKKKKKSKKGVKQTAEKKSTKKDQKLKAKTGKTTSSNKMEKSETKPSKSTIKLSDSKSRTEQKRIGRKAAEENLGMKSSKKTQKHSLAVTDSSDEEISDADDKLASSSDDSVEEQSDEEANKKADQSSSSSGDSESGYEDSTNVSIPGPDLMRGEGNVESSSSSDSSSDEEDDEEEEEEEKEELEHGWGELDKDAPRDEMTTCRLAVCNMDWDRVKAQDILVLFNSFKPTGGVIKSVTIYPSEYGKQRMKEEDMKGPLELLEKGPEDEKKVDTEDGDEYHREKLRKYQLQRLKYYYAVVECDSKSTGANLYEQCDGLEYQSSSTVIDLRFIPDDMTFDEEEVKDVATDMPDAALYTPVEFRTTALHQSKVELTWDETDHLREKKTIEVFGKKDVDDVDVKAYLASSSGEEDNITRPAFEIEEEDFGEADDVDDEQQISKYKALLQGIDDKEKEEKEEMGAGLEISWEPGLKDTAEELVKKKMEGKTELTPWEKYLEKKKEKKKNKRDEKKQASKKVSSADVSDKQQVEEQAAFSDDDIPAGVDLTDSFFKDSLKDTEGGVAKGDGKKKQKQKKQESLTAEEMEKQQQKQAELELLMMDEDDDKQHFNLKDIIEGEKKGGKKRKRKHQEKEDAKQEDNFQIDVKDPRFDAIYSSHLYSIDPSDSQYKKTKSMEALVKEKQQRRARKDLLERTEDKRQKKERKTEDKKSSGSKKDQELSMLIKSVKNKTQQYNAKKSKKQSR